MRIFVHHGLAKVFVFFGFPFSSFLLVVFSWFANDASKVLARAEQVKNYTTWSMGFAL